MLIKSDNPAFSYMGRIDFSNPQSPILIYAGSMIKVNFSGTSLQVIMENVCMNEYNAFGVMLDGIQHKIELQNEAGEKAYCVAENLENSMHTLTIFKRQAAQNYLKFGGIIIDDGALAENPQRKYDMKLEVFGDSVSAGEVTEAIYYESHSDPENHKGFYDNSWFSYSLSLARKLNAEIHNNSQGGLALFDKTGYFSAPDYVGLETTYSKLSYVPYSYLKYTDWDFAKYTPDLVIIAIGQNDANPNPEAVNNEEYRRKWIAKYTGIIKNLQKHYGENTRFLSILTVLQHDSAWDKLVEEAVKSLNNDNVRYHKLCRCGQATPGHPRITEQEEMALELEQVIRNW